MCVCVCVCACVCVCVCLCFQVTCYDWDSDGSHDLIGTFETNLAELEVWLSGRGLWANLLVVLL